MENELLEASFSESEVKEAIFGSYVEGARGPDVFSFLFYQVFWEVTKKIPYELVLLLEQDNLNLDSLNYAMINPYPKRT